MRLTIVIVNWNAAGMLRDCLDSLTGKVALKDNGETRLDVSLTARAVKHCADREAGVRGVNG